MIKLKDLLFERQWSLGDYGGNLMASLRGKVGVTPSLDYAYELHDGMQAWDQLYSMDITPKVIATQLRLLRALLPAVLEAFEEAVKLGLAQKKNLSSAKTDINKATQTLEKLKAQFDEQSKYMDPTERTRNNPINRIFGEADNVLSNIHSMLDWITLNKSTKRVNEDSGYQVGTHPDQGWTNTGAAPDTNMDKADNTVWFDTLGHAKDVIRELETHLDALSKVQDKAGSQSTNLQAGEIFDVLKDCHDELSRLTGTGTVIPKAQTQNWPSMGQ